MKRRTSLAAVTALALALVGNLTMTQPALSADATSSDCKGPPDKAVTALPQPFDSWAQIICTPVGPVIAAHKNWMWQNLGSPAPVFIPAQMKRMNVPVEGSEVFFTRIDFRKVDSEEGKIPYAAFHSIFSGDPVPESAYRLDLSSSNGRTLRLYFLETGNNRAGFWCNDGTCDPNSFFMLLDMKHRPDSR